MQYLRISVEKAMKTGEAIISKEKSSEEKAVKSGLSRLIKNALPNLATSRVTNGLYDDYIFLYTNYYEVSFKKRLTKKCFLPFYF